MRIVREGWERLACVRFGVAAPEMREDQNHVGVPTTDLLHFTEIVRVTESRPLGDV